MKRMQQKMKRYSEEYICDENISIKEYMIRKEPKIPEEIYNTKKTRKKKKNAIEMKSSMTIYFQNLILRCIYFLIMKLYIKAKMERETNLSVEECIMKNERRIVVEI